MNKAAGFWLALLFVFAGGFGIWLATKYSASVSTGGSAAESDREYVKLPPDSKEPWLKEFTLTERSGKLVSSKDLAGKVYVTSFFFSSCPGSCLQQNEKVRELEQEFGKQGVQFLSITCDPDIDTPERLREYAARLQAHPEHWWFLTGDLTYIRRVAGEIFQIAMDRQTHSEKLFVKDKWGNARGFYDWKALDEMTHLKTELKKLLTETEPPADLKKPPQPTVVEPTTSEIE